MSIIPKLVPLSELAQRQAEIFASLDEGPLVLTQENRAAGVLVDPTYWNQVIQELEDLRDALDAIDAYQTYRLNPSDVKPWSVVRESLVLELVSRSFG
jgi:PHD/YefM family antitoxin component YafN of YafNO toxin-antitoxin module